MSSFEPKTNNVYLKLLQISVFFLLSSPVLAAPGNYFFSRMNNSFFSHNKAFSVPTHIIPGRIEAEDYRSYTDVTPKNEGKFYRTDAVDIQRTSDVGGGFNIGWTRVGELLNYRVQIKENARYKIFARVASVTSNGSLKVKLDNTVILDQWNIPNTSGWQRWQTISFETDLPQGIHSFEVVFNTSGINLNYFTVQKLPVATPIGNSGTPNVPAPQPTVAPIPRPTIAPTIRPTILPTLAPTVIPTMTPTAAPTAIPTVTPLPNTASQILLQGNKLLVNGNVFHIKGVNWNPVELGKTHPAGLDFAGAAVSDIPLMKAAGINVVRTFETLTDKVVLDALHSNGIYVLNSIYVYGGNSIDSIDALVNATKNHPAILMWLVGNEWNYNGFYTGLSFENSLNRVNQAAQRIKSLDTTHPVATVYGELPSANILSQLSSIDVWGLNVYRGFGFGSLFDQWKLLSSKPMFVAEYGADAFNASLNRQDPNAQADAVSSLTQDIMKNSATTGGVTLGGVVFEWADEWWKAGNPSVQDTGGIAPGGGPHPDGVFNEEFWGLVDIYRTPRPAYFALQTIYQNNLTLPTPIPSTTPAPIVVTPSPVITPAPVVSPMPSTTPRPTATPVPIIQTPLPSAAPTPSNQPAPVNPAAANIRPLFISTSAQAGPVTQINADGSHTTFFADRVRNRHGREFFFNSEGPPYEGFNTRYFENRTYKGRIDDRTAQDGCIDVRITSIHPMNNTNLRTFFIGGGTVALYSQNYTMDTVNNRDFSKTICNHPLYNFRRLQKGDVMEFEVGIFLNQPIEGRTNYYSRAVLYQVGEGVVPWIGGRGINSSGEGTLAGQRVTAFDSVVMPTALRLGGLTTASENQSHELDKRYQQAAENIANDNMQNFVEGRRLLHTNFTTGHHTENGNSDGSGNPPMLEHVNKAGPLFTNNSCVGCHVKNGKGSINTRTGELNSFVVNVGVLNPATNLTSPHPIFGSSLDTQASPTSTQAAEGNYVLNGFEAVQKVGPSGQIYTLQKPVFQSNANLNNTVVSVRNSPALIGMGLLEAIDEQDILKLADPNDTNNDGISGKASVVTDRITQESRLGRFGWKASEPDLKHQVLKAARFDMGIANAMFPKVGEGIELTDSDINKMVSYLRLLAVPPARTRNIQQYAVWNPANSNLPNGVELFTARERLFSSIGCAGCHTTEMKTSANHPVPELRNQNIKPYTDLLLHDMGSDLSDTISENQATFSEWRTAPLWGIGLTKTVNPNACYLHDCRARTIEEAILWHGGEAEASKQNYLKLNNVEQQEVLEFLNAL
ncbi:MAG: di-heme oxidoredictase family protein [Pseudomonadota bacterium]